MPPQVTPEVTRSLPFGHHGLGWREFSASRWLKDCAAERDVTLGTHYWPHDGDRESLFLEGGTLTVAAKQGMRPSILQRPVNKVEAISTARAIFPRCQFDEVGCSVGLKRLRAYRKEWDGERGVWKDRPRHDDASHGADAFMTFACSRIADEEEPRSRESDRYRRPYTRHDGLSWMAA